jgi:hypothetical protein
VHHGKYRQQMVRQEYFAPGIFVEDVRWGAKRIHPAAPLGIPNTAETAPPVDDVARASAAQGDPTPTPKPEGPRGRP